MKRRLLYALLLLVLAGAAFSYWTLHTAPGARWVWNRASGATDGQLQAAGLSGDLGDGLLIEGLAWQSDGVHVIADRTRLEFNLDLLPLRAEVRALHIDTLTVTTSASDSGEAGDTDATTNIEALLETLRLPLEIDLLDVRVDRLNVNENEALLTQLVLALAWDERIDLMSLRASSEHGDIDASASLNLDHSRQLTVDAGLTTAGERWDASVDGTPTAFVLALSGPPIEANAAVELPAAGQDGVDIDADLARLLPATYLDDWPEDLPVSGSFAATIRGRQIDLERSEFRAADSGLQAAGGIDLNTSLVDLSLSWQKLRWPLAGEVAEIRSEDAEIQVSGRLDDWQLDGDIAIAGESVPPGRFRLSAAGGEDDVSGEIHDSAVLGGSIRGEFAYRWRDTSPWSASLTLAGIRTDDLPGAYAGVLSGELAARGTQQPLSVVADRLQLAGELDGQPFEAVGALTHDDETTRAQNLSIRHGDSTILLNGSADTDAGLRFELSVSDLGRYVDEASGALSANGVFTRRESGRILFAEIQSQALEIGGQLVEDVEAALDFATDAQSVAVAAKHRDIAVSLQSRGSFSDWREPAASDWVGAIDEFSLRLPDGTELKLDGAATLRRSDGDTQLQDFCLLLAGDSQLCTSLVRAADGAFAVESRAEDFPLQRLAELAGADIEMSQRLSGSAALAIPAGGALGGSSRLSISAGAIGKDDGQSPFLETDAGEINLTLANGRLLSGTARLPLTRGGRVDADFSVQDVSDTADSPVTGNASIELPDLAFAAHLLPAIDAVAGQLDGELTLAGTVGEPLIDGNATLSGGSLSYQPLGLVLDDIELQGELGRSRNFEVGGSFRAGDGVGQIVSRSASGNQSGLQFGVEGSDLQLINLPELRATVSPNFEVAYAGESLQLDGEIAIPRARIRPVSLAESAVTESEDVVIVAGELPPTAIAETPEGNTHISGELRLVLGDDVRIDLDAARARMTGAADFRWEGDALPLGDGRFDIAGNVAAFGQVLDITEGAIRFPRVPANDPVLRIRAEREIYGNTQVKRAGVRIDGTASQPEIRAYTDPRTTEERALTLLVTGSDFDYEQGVGALDFGTYIAPRLFVSYGVGIFDRDNVVSARYDLSRGFGIKMSSGNKASGVDLSYQFEN